MFFTACPEKMLCITAWDLGRAQLTSANWTLLYFISFKLSLELLGVSRLHTHKRSFKDFIGYNSGVPAMRNLEFLQQLETCNFALLPNGIIDLRNSNHHSAAGPSAATQDAASAPSCKQLIIGPLPIGLGLVVVIML